MKILVTMIGLLLSFQAFAGFGAYSGTQNLGLFQYFTCSTGLTCSKVGAKLNVTAAPATAAASGYTNFHGFIASTLTGGTSTNGNSATVYLSQIFVPFTTTLTGIKVNNAGTVGTNKYIGILYNSLGVPVASSALAGILTASASTFQSLAFTSPYLATGPGIYWLGIQINGATDAFYTTPAVGEPFGKTGSVAGQVFGTLSNISLPTTFTAGSGVIGFTY